MYRFNTTGHCWFRSNARCRSRSFSVDRRCCWEGRSFPHSRSTNVRRLCLVSRPHFRQSVCSRCIHKTLLRVNFRPLPAGSHRGKMAPGARHKFSAPMFEPNVFQEQMHCFEESTCQIVGFFSVAPSDSAPGAFFSLCTLRYRVYQCLKRCLRLGIYARKWFLNLTRWRWL